MQVEQITAAILEDRIRASIRVLRRFADEPDPLRPELFVVTPTVVGDEGHHRPARLPVGVLELLRGLVSKVERQLDSAVDQPIPAPAARRHEELSEGWARMIVEPSRS